MAIPEAGDFDYDVRDVGGDLVKRKIEELLSGDFKMLNLSLVREMAYRLVIDDLIKENKELRHKFNAPFTFEEER